MSIINFVLIRLNTQLHIDPPSFDVTDCGVTWDWEFSFIVPLVWNKFPILTDEGIENSLFKQAVFVSFWSNLNLLFTTMKGNWH